VGIVGCRRGLCVVWVAGWFLAAIVEETLLGLTSRVCSTGRGGFVLRGVGVDWTWTLLVSCVGFRGNIFRGGINSPVVLGNSDGCGWLIPSPTTFCSLRSGFGVLDWRRCASSSGRVGPYFSASLATRLENGMSPVPCGDRSVTISSSVAFGRPRRVHTRSSSVTEFVLEWLGSA
jgi:hypothetical protein